MAQRTIMYTSYDDIQQLIGQANESNDLEFKRGDFLDNLDSATRDEIVRDVSAFANAGGGTLIYGIEEDRSKNSVASALFPTKNHKIDELQLTQIIYAGLDPVFKKFDVCSIDAPDGGKVFIITVEKADTAHQCKSDRKYYHRVGTSRPAMCDYEIRDVMNRRTAPLVRIQYQISTIQQDASQHVYAITPTLINEGQVTANMWAIEVILPQGGTYENLFDNLANIKERLHQYPAHGVLEFSYDRTPTKRPAILMPGQSWSIDPQHGYKMIQLTVTEQSRRLLSRNDPPILLRLYVDNCVMQETQISFNEWCQF